MIGVVGSGVCDIVEHLFSIETVSFGDGQQTHRSESTFGIDVKTFALTSSHVDGQLAGDCKSMAELTSFPS